MLPDIKNKMSIRMVLDYEAILDFSNKNKNLVDTDVSTQIRIMSICVSDSIRAFYYRKGFIPYLFYKLGRKYKLNWLRNHLTPKDIIELFNHLKELESDGIETTEKKK